MRAGRRFGYSRLIGLEAGQSAFGDIYAWFKRVLEYPLREILSKSTLIDETTKQKLIEETADRIIPALTAEAEKIPISESTIIATDWMNGRRTPDADQLLKGTITGLTLGSDVPVFSGLWSKLRHSDRKPLSIVFAAKACVSTMS